jgi:4-hydroxybenzoate polyprenyltransferase
MNKGLINNNILIVFLTQFIRIKGVINWSGVSFVGFILGLSSLDISANLIPFLTFLISTFFIMSFTFSINNFYDTESDRTNPRRKSVNAIASGKISIRAAIILNTSFVIIPLIISFLFKFEVFLFCILILFWMWSYSSPPLRLKGRPGLDIIWHFFAFVFFIFWGSSISGNIDTINILVAISFGVWSCIAQLLNHINDYTSDKESGTVTFAVWKGLYTAKITLKFFVILNIIFLLPLILLYLLNFVFTIILIIAGFIISIFVRPKKDFPVSSRYFAPFVFSAFVYLSCVVYYLFLLLGVSTI